MQIDSGSAGHPRPGI